MSNKHRNHSSGLEDLLSEIDDELEIESGAKSPSESQTAAESVLSDPHEEIDLGEGFFLYVNEQKTQALLKYFPSTPPQCPAYKTLELIQRIKDEGFTYGLLEKNIQKALKIIRENSTAEVDVTAAIGRDTTEGHPPEIDYWIGNEEFSKVSGTIQARKNDLLMRVSPAKPGIPGMRITGEEIAPEPIKETDIFAGDHVRRTDENEYYADCAGTVIFKDNILSISELSRDASALITVTEDGMQALLSIDPPLGKGNPITLEEVKSLLTEAGVWGGIQERDILREIQRANEELQPVQNAVIARGKDPTKGRDASVTWHIHPKMQRDRFVINEDGTVDFYNQNNVLTVTEGDHLLTIHHPRPGRNGANVLGEILPGQPGQPLTMEPGPNIETRKNGTEWYAECTGLYRLCNDILEIQPLFFVKGDVDFSIGNIDFNGDVIITGNVLDGFEVRAKGAISVIGTVEAAILEAGQCVEIKNGIFGKGKGRIVAGKNVVTQFLQNAEVRADQDVIIGSQILNSRVFARRNVVVRRGKGSLVGGLTVAGFEVKSKTIGSEYGVKTVIEVGTDFSVLERMIYIGQKEKTLVSKSEQLENAIEQEIQSYEGFHFDEKDNELITNARKRQKALKHAIDNLKFEYQTQAAGLHVTDHPRITATEAVMPDVFVRVHDARYKFQHPVRGAVVGWDKETGKITVKHRKG